MTHPVTMNEREIWSIENWVRNHKLGCPTNSFSINQSSRGGIGVTTEIKCGCGKTGNMTDYSVW